MSRRSVFSVIFVIALFFAGLFAWQVFSYYQKIQNGTISAHDLPSYNFASKLTTSKIAKAAAANASSAADIASTDDPTLGPVNAPLTIVEFGDFQCPYSKEASYVIRRAAATFGDKVRVIYRDFPLSDLHPDAELAAEAGDCANEQGLFWPFHDKLFANQNDLSKASMIDYAGQVGMSTNKFESCLNSGKFKAEVVIDSKAGSDAGITGTPTFFFNGQKIEGSIPEDIMTQIIQAFIPAT